MCCSGCLSPGFAIVGGLFGRDTIGGYSDVSGFR